MTITRADLVWTGARFERGLQVRHDHGKIVAVEPETNEPGERLEQRALLPGFVNTHSHAFQRGLRGHGERFPHGAGNFWTWREKMYRLVLEMRPGTFHRAAVDAFREMRAAGVTTVAEFHYLHHAGGDDDYVYDEMVLDAAREAGVRIVLLNAYYNRGGIGRPLSGAQRRFRSSSPDAYWKQMDRLIPLTEGDQRWLGAAVHSVRAATREDLAAVYQESLRRGLVCHIHMEEQRREIDQCLDAYGCRPMHLLLDLDVGANLTAVHCTHTDPEDMRRYRERGGGVCLCPLTEASLGDGIPDVPDIGNGVALGTGSNARISMLEEMRWLEFGQRLSREGRGILRDAGGRSGPVLLRAGTEEGARALGVPAGRIAPGFWADFVALDLLAPSLAGWGDDTLLDTFLFGGGDRAIAATCVAGRWS